MAVSAWRSIRLLQNLRKNLKTSCVCKKTSVSLQYASGALSCGRSFTSATHQHIKEKEDPVSPKVDDPDSEEERKKREASWKTVKYGFTAIGVSLGLAGAYAIIELGSPEKDDQGNRIEDEFTNMPIVPQYLRRTWRQMNYFKKMIREPSRDKLLPDPLTWPYTQPPYTLVLEMTDVLVHPDWTYQTGWRFKKRPGVDQFLEQVAPPLFEVVVFTAEQGMTVFPILDALDPNGYIMYRLVRDATHFVDGHHVKNLDCLNRDLSKVIVVDWNSESVKFHHRNTLLVPRWRGNDDDRSLLDLAAFLRTIAVTKVEDVREVLDYYHQFDNPIEAFRENQRKLMEQLEEKEKQQQEKQRGSALTKNWTSSFLQQRKL